MIKGIHYLNSGDWVESLTAILEHEDEQIEIIDYKQFCQLLDEKEKRNLKSPDAKIIENELLPVEEDED